MAFIKLTEPKGGPIYMNVPSIEAFFADGEGSKIIPTSATDDETYYMVKESPEEIMKIIEKDYIPF